MTVPSGERSADTAETRCRALECSPDGEVRARLARLGDLFPLDPMDDLLGASGEPSSAVRPWGLRFARPMDPRAGRHEGATSRTTGSGQTDGNSPEDFERD